MKRFNYLGQNFDEMRYSLNHTIAVLFSMLFFSCTQAQTADEIIAKHIAATGGAEKWGKVQNIQFVGNYVMGPGMLAPVENIVATQPAKSNYSSFTWQGMTAVTVVVGDSGWNYNPFSGKRETDPMNAEGLRLNSLSSDPQGALFDYKSKGYKADYLGTDDMDGEDVHILRLTNKLGDMIYYYIDASTYYALKISRRVRMPDKEEKSQSVLSDFRKNEFGIIIPYSEQNVNDKGEEIGGPVQYSKIVVNGNIDPSKFKEPNTK